MQVLSSRPGLIITMDTHQVQPHWVVQPQSKVIMQIQRGPQHIMKRYGLSWQHI